ncbi:hypothetical protein HDK64DRAFT_252798 [Phyllosticta capitalensis]
MTDFCVAVLRAAAVLHHIYVAQTFAFPSSLFEPLGQIESTSKKRRRQSKEVKETGQRSKRQKKCSEQRACVRAFVAPSGAPFSLSSLSSLFTVVSRRVPSCCDDVWSAVVAVAWVPIVCETIRRWVDKDGSEALENEKPKDEKRKKKGLDEMQKKTENSKLQDHGPTVLMALESYDRVSSSSSTSNLANGNM